MKKEKYKGLLPLAAAAVLTVLAVSGLFGTLETTANDLTYQRTGAVDGQILVVAMDQKSLEALGPMPWPRSYMAQVIQNLNADPQNAPAVIGVDVLYAGQSSDPAADAALVEAAWQGGNVITAGAAQFGSQLVTEGENFHMDSGAVLGWDDPFSALAQVTQTGHINAMPDSDGYLRHSLLEVRKPDGTMVPSMARLVYERYAAYHGLEVSELPETANGFFYLPFAAGPGAYDNALSFVDVMKGAVSPETFAGKMVLIGPYAAGMQDEYHTAADHGVPMYGVEILANQIEAFRQGFYPREAPKGLQWGLLLLWSALFGWFLQERSVKTSILTWLGSCGMWLGICLILYRLGFILNVMWIPLASTVQFVASVAINYIRSSQEKRRITATFGRYVDPAILKELLVQGGAAEQLGGEMKQIAVLFVDIRGFTTMSEALEPTVVVEIINKYLTLTTQCIMRCQGTLDKFVGDCTMAFWNAPVPQENAVYLACRAAMDMVAGSQALGEELQRTYGRTVSFGVGVHVGPAVVGNIGAPQRMDYTAIGDTVNTAARLEANAPGGKILISRAVADALGNQAKTTSLGSTIKLKGKADGFEILTLDELS